MVLLTYAYTEVKKKKNGKQDWPKKTQASLKAIYANPVAMTDR